jgi:hypothetical protein
LFAVEQASLPDGLLLDALSVEQDGLCSAEEDIGGCHVVQAFVVAAVVVVLDEGVDPRFELAGKVVVLEQDAVLECLMPALDLALGLGMTWRTAEMLDLPLVEPLGETRCNVAGTIIRQQARFVWDAHLVATGSGERLLKCAGAAGCHCGAELPGDDVAREVIEGGREVGTGRQSFKPNAGCPTAVLCSSPTLAFQRWSCSLPSVATSV